MKWAITILFLLLTCITYNIKSQHILQSAISSLGDSLDCIIRGELVDYVGCFQIDSMLPDGTIIHWTRIDSIKGLPCGLNYAVNDPDLTYERGESGCISYTGITNDEEGLYCLCFYVTSMLTINMNTDTYSYSPCSFFPGDPCNYIRVKASMSDTCKNISDYPGPFKEGCTAIFTGSTPVKTATNNFRNKVYPNPFTNELIIELEAQGKINLRIFDVFGKETYSEELASTGKFIIRPDIAHMQDGIYFLEIAGETKIWFEKIVKTQ